MRIRGLRRKILRLAIAVALPLVIYIGYQVFHLYEDLSEIALQDLEADARVGGAAFDSLVHQLVEQGQSVGLAVLAGDRTRSESEQYLRSLGQHSPIAGFTVFDTRGNVIASGVATPPADVASLPEFRRVLEGAPFAVTPLRADPAGRMGFLTLAPVGVPLRGVVAIPVEAQDMGTVIRRDPDVSVVVVTDATGRLAYTNLTGTTGMEAGRNIAADMPLVAEALRDGTVSSSRVYLPGVGDPFIGAQSRVASIGWTVGVYAPRALALRHVYRETVSAASIVVVVLIAAAIAGRVLSSAILRPIEELTEAAGRLSEGDFDALVAVRSDDEIGELADGFREMQQNIQHNFSAVDERALAGERLNEVTTTGEVAHIGAEHLRRLLHADACLVTLFGDEERIFLAGEADSHAMTDDARGRVSDASLRGRDYRLHLLDKPGTRYPKGRFLVSLPLASEGDERGRADIIAAPTHTTPQFVRGDIELAVGLAQQIAVALANAARFELESRIAETLQDALLTPPFPIPRMLIGLAYRPASHGARVGGDFYDLIRIDDRRFVLLLGDISGHGLEAARHTTAAKGSLRSFALEDPSPRSVLRRTNAVLAGQLEPGTFVTLFYSLLDTEDGALTTANAGHPPPFLLTGAERAQSVLQVGGPPLGVAPGFDYEQHVLRLQDGDEVVAFSDGLTDVRNTEGDFFGEQGVSKALAERHLLRPADLATALVEAAASFGSGHVTDDVAVLAFQRVLDA